MSEVEVYQEESETFHPSIIIPAKNEAAGISAVVTAASAQSYGRTEVEVIVVDDGSTDGTAAVARRAGARVVALGAAGGSPAIGRNRGAAVAVGDPLVFLDADCIPEPGWLRALLSAHGEGEGVVGGSLDLPAGLPISARCDYYCGWYHVHSRRTPGYVPNHPPGNLSIRRELFFSTRGFVERQPIAFAHEELAWQADLAARGHRIYFEPRARVLHRNRSGFGNLLRRNYRWAYSAIETKAGTAAARMAWIYRYPKVLVAASMPLAAVQAVYIVACWARARIWEPVVLFPAVLAARLAYAAGMMVGGTRWMRQRKKGRTETRPRWE